MDREEKRREEKRREEKSNKADARRRMKVRSIKGFISTIKMPLTMA
ncbi:hypothetical protein [Vibrio campbellii]|nr:hypothetical protein [Vibrio campbellii]